MEIIEIQNQTPRSATLIGFADKIVAEQTQTPRSATLIGSADEIITEQKQTTTKNKESISLAPDKQKKKRNKFVRLLRKVGKELLNSMEYAAVMPPM